MRNKNILDSLYTPNDRLGVQMFGVDCWNNLKNRVCGITSAVIDRSYYPTHAVNANYTPLFEVLFVPNRSRFCELLGADAPIDFISSDWAKGISSIGSGITNALNNIPLFTPWIAAGRQTNEGVAKILKSFGLSSNKAETVAPTVTKVGLGLGGALLIGGGIYLVYKLSKKRKRS